MEVFHLRQLEETRCSKIYSAELKCSTRDVDVDDQCRTPIPIIVQTFEGSHGADLQTKVQLLLQLCQHHSVPRYRNFTSVAGSVGLILQPRAVQAPPALQPGHSKQRSSVCCLSGLREEDIRQAATEAAHAMENVHARKVIYNGLRTSTVFLALGHHPKQPTCCLSNFEIAEHLEGNSTIYSHAPAAALHRRQATSCKINLARIPPQQMPYAAPELLMGRPVDTSADVWSFGCMLWELAMGYSLFGDASGDPNAILARISALMDLRPPIARSANA
eukprot:jgi/Ulvmu1/6468/UM003_0099.1